MAERTTSPANTANALPPEIILAICDAAERVSQTVQAQVVATPIDTVSTTHTTRADIIEAAGRILRMWANSDLAAEIERRQKGGAA